MSCMLGLSESQDSSLSRHFQRPLGPDGIRDVCIRVITPSAPAIVYRVRNVWSIRDDSCRSLLVATAPKPLAGTGILLIERKGRDALDVWLRLRTAQREIRLGAARLDQPVLGTDFSYDDLRFWLPADGLEETAVDGSTAILRRTDGCHGYRTARWRDADALRIDRASGLLERAAWHSKSGALVREFHAEGVVQLDGVSMPRSIRVERPRERYRSEMHLEHFGLLAAPDESLFAPERLISSASEALMLRPRCAIRFADEVVSPAGPS